MSIARVFFVLMLSAGVVACASNLGGSTTPQSFDRSTTSRQATPAPSPRIWLMQGPAIESELFATGDGGTAPQDQKYFVNSNHVVFYPAFVNQTPAATPPPSWTVVRWVKFNSYGCFQWTMNGDPSPAPSYCPPGPMPTGITAVAYDNENWGTATKYYTPCQEWQTASSCNSLPGGLTGNGAGGTPDPSTIENSMNAFAQLAHQHNYKVMFTPAFDLFEGSGNKYTAFEDSGILQAVASSADYYHIQAQGLEGNSSSYASLVKTIYNDLLTANPTNPNMVVTAGLSNYDSTIGQPFTPTDIVDAVNATATAAPGIAGYWPNYVSTESGGDTVWNNAISTLITQTPRP